MKTISYTFSTPLADDVPEGDAYEMARRIIALAFGDTVAQTFEVLDRPSSFSKRPTVPGQCSVCGWNSRYPMIHPMHRLRMSERGPHRQKGQGA
jgi:hypothetical protein